MASPVAAVEKQHGGSLAKRVGKLEGTACQERNAEEGKRASDLQAIHGRGDAPSWQGPTHLNPRSCRVEAFFKRHGNQAIFLGRFIGFARALVPFVAGPARMNYRRSELAGGR